MTNDSNMGEPDTAELPAPLARGAVARAHHRYYCLEVGHTCTEIEEADYDFADELAEILALLPKSKAGDPE